MPDLTAPLPPLTRTQRLVYWTAAVVCAGTRFLAMARTLWDWDEALFCLGMRSYDVTSHHPHPPGFPVYIGTAKLVRLIVHDDFRALQALNLIAAVLVFPAMFFLARELRLRFETSAIAAALFAFFPNVWFFGGTAFSDVPSIVLVVFAIAMLFRGVRSRSAYFIGALALSLAIGIRPQNLLVGLFPGILASYYRARSAKRDVVVAALIGIAVCAIAYGAAIYATGSYSRYVMTIRGHGEYISTIDSFRNPDRPPLWRIFDRFFIKQYDAPALSILATLFVLISAVGAIRTRDRRILYIFLAFAPFAISAWLMLDRFSISRFSIGYAPLFAIMAADGIARASTRKPWLEPLIGTALLLAFLLWTLPALTPVRDSVAPPVVAVKALRQHLQPRRDQLYVGFSMVPFVEYFDPYYPYVRVLDERAMPLSSTSRRSWLLMELDATPDRGYVFTRDRGRLWNISRRHYFDVALAPIREFPQFVSGWYPAERSGSEEWRWMAGHSVTVLPPASADVLQRVRLMFDLPDELMPQHPTITVAFNGVIVDRFKPATAHGSRDCRVTAASNGAPNRLDLSIDRVINPLKHHTGRDPRDLGLRVSMLSWGAD